MNGIDPALLGLRHAPALREAMRSSRTHDQLDRGPVPDAGWAELVYPELAPADALARLWDESVTSAGSTSPIRWRPGSSGSRS